MDSHELIKVNDAVNGISGPCVTRRRVRRLGTALASGCFFAMLAGCTQVDPRVELDRTLSLITESTGVDLVNDAGPPLLSAEQWDAALSDGLTLDDALRLALLYNRQLQVDFLAIGVAKADLVQSGLFSNPTLAFSAQFPEGGGRSNVQASLAQNIVDLWQIPRKKQVAQARLEETVFRIARLAGDLVAEVRSMYYAAVAADERVTLARATLDLVTKSYNTVKAQREAGAASLLDENLSRGQVLTADLGVRNARLAMANAKRRLARAMAIPQNVDELRLADPLPEPEGTFPSVETLVETARSRRLDLRALATAVQAAEAKVRLETLKVFPDISVGPFVERGERRALPGRNVAADFARASLASGAPTIPGIQSRSERRAARRQEIDALFGPALSMTLPLFDQNQAQIAKARYQYQQTVKSYEALHLAVAQDIRIVLDQTETAAASAVFYRDEIIPQADRNLEFATASYQAGQASILALLEAQRLLVEAKRGHIQAWLDAATARAALSQTLGVPIDAVKE